MKINCRVVKTPEELEMALYIRNEVFLKEQGLFAKNDWDKQDETATHIIAEIEGEIVGTVRLYHQDKEVWVGGRLAVLPGKRGWVGGRLVRAAVEEASRSGAKQFIAAVQIQNISFFKRLGWRTIGTKFIVQGREHCLMEANLAGSASTGNNTNRQEEAVQ
jgi:putative N-acetyltransferase (TIGR04045 family)